MTNISEPETSVNVNSHRSLQDLDLLDAFLFGASTENPKNAELIARIIIERATGRHFGKVIVQTEKQILGTEPSNRGIRIDMHVTEYDNEEIIRVYDIEPNNYVDKNLPKRSRYYQALSDVKSLTTGQAPEQLPEFISIWILPYDPFGENRMIYTVKNSVAENHELVYNDDVVKLFLYVDGEIGGSERLRNLLKYMSHTNSDNVVDADLEQLQDIINFVKGDKEVYKRFMDYETVKALAIQEAHREVKASLYIQEMELEAKAKQINAMQSEIDSKQAEINSKQAEIDSKQSELDSKQSELDSKQSELDSKQSELDSVKTKLDETRKRDIAILIKSLRDFGADDSLIIDKLVKEYSLTEDKAKQLVNSL